MYKLVVYVFKRIVQKEMPMNKTTETFIEKHQGRSEKHQVTIGKKQGVIRGTDYSYFIRLYEDISSKSKQRK
jgi:hypothetical protein